MADEKPTLYARMVPHAPTENITFRAAPSGPGCPRSFSKEMPWVPVLEVTAKFLSSIQLDGEPVRRGGKGGPMFEVVDYDRMMEIVAEESERNAAQQAGGAAFQNYLRASADADSKRKALADQEARIDEKMAAIDRRIALLDRLTSSIGAEPQPVVEAVVPSAGTETAPTGGDKTETTATPTGGDDGEADKAKPKRVGQRRTMVAETGEP